MENTSRIRFGPELNPERLLPMSPNFNSTMQDPLVVLLLGPTGSGKTALSLALAERFGGEIVSCDSVAVYRGMDLGTAKPSIEERARVPHHLIDVVDPDEAFTAGEYSRQARAALREIAGRGKLPIVTGGTGLYLRALTEGLFEGPVRQDALRARLRRSAEKRGVAWLHRVADAPVSATIGAADHGHTGRTPGAEQGDAHRRRSPFRLPCGTNAGSSPWSDRQAPLAPGRAAPPARRRYG